MISTAINGIVVLPNYLQLAYGLIRPILFIKIILLFIALPFLFLIVPIYGAKGAAFIWIAINGCNMLASSHILYQRLLIGENKIWYIEDIGRPFLIVLLIVGTAYLFIPRDISNFFMLFFLLIILSITSIISLITASRIRKAALALIMRIVGYKKNNPIC